MVTCSHCSVCVFMSLHCITEHSLLINISLRLHTQELNFLFSYIQCVTKFLQMLSYSSLFSQATETIADDLQHNVLQTHVFCQVYTHESYCLVPNGIQFHTLTVFFVNNGKIFLCTALFTCQITGICIYHSNEKATIMLLGTLFNHRYKLENEEEIKHDSSKMR